MDLCFYIFTAPYDGRKKSAKKSQVTLQVHSQSAMLGEGEGVWGVKKYVWT